jgi:hypothetical protein
MRWMAALALLVCLAPADARRAKAPAPNACKLVRNGCNCGFECVPKHQAYKTCKRACPESIDEPEPRCARVHGRCRLDSGH